MEEFSRSVPSRVLGRAFALARRYLREFKYIRAIDFWFNGATVMLRHVGDPPNDLDYPEGVEWHNIGTLNR